MHLPCPTYCHQPHQTRRMNHHVLAHACPLRLMPQWRLRPSLVGSSTADAESCSLVLRSIGFLQRCSPPHLAVTQLRFGYHLFSWFQIVPGLPPGGVVLLDGARTPSPRSARVAPPIEHRIRHRPDMRRLANTPLSEFPYPPKKPVYHAGTTR
jgi:hypothetical protein